MILSKMGIRLSKEDGEALKAGVDQAREALGTVNVSTKETGGTKPSGWLAKFAQAAKKAKK